MTDAPPSSMLFICDFPPGFTGATHHGQGVGGTEALVVVLAETLAARGIDVTVAARVPGASRLHGVSYIPVSSARPREAGVTVLVKRWSEAAAGAGSRRFFLATDVHVPDPAELARNITWSNVSAALSPFMRSSLIAVVAAPMMHVLPPPLALSDYPNPSDKRGPALVYCSVPDRGLYYLKDLFPAIRRRVPEATLAITSDFTLWGEASAKEAFMRFFEGQPGVEYLGHVDRATLLAEQRRARVLAYPCTFEEGFCIAAAECMAAGAVPVTTNAFALTTTVGDAGVLINGRPRSWFYRRRFVKAAVRLLTDDVYWRERSMACRHHARSWDAPSVADQFLALVARAGTDRG
jgi:glycosyltransferase involved in cell wall biosynthesis